MEHTTRPTVVTHRMIPFLFFFICLNVIGGFFIPLSAKAQSLTDGWTFSVGTTVSCSQAASIYDTTGQCRSACTSGEFDATKGMSQAFSGVKGLTVNTSFCSGQEVCCIIPTTALASAIQSGNFPKPDAAKLVSILGGTSVAKTQTAQTAVFKNSSALKGGYGLISPLGNRSVPQIIGGAVQWLGGLAGSLFFLMLLWGGIEYMTARGDGGQVKKAQARIVASVSGIIVILIAYMAVATIIGLVPR